jgi:excisionase family DNA binding protein
MPRFFTLAQVAERIATPAETVRYWVHLGKLPAYKPGRQVLIREDDLDAFMSGTAVTVVRAQKAQATRTARTAAKRSA